MRLGGYTKLTLQDFPDRVAAICFTLGCQLRCPYCHNADLVLSDGQHRSAEGEALTRTFLSYLRQRKTQLDGVVVSGGEPLLQQDILRFLHEIKDMGLAVKLDTNGLLPSKLRDLIQQDLVDYVAMDYKNCRRDLAATVGLDPSDDRGTADSYYNNWWASLTCLRENKVPYEIRTTVVRELHPPDALRHMAASIGESPKHCERWFLQPFVRNGPVMCDGLQNETNLSAYTDEEMQTIRMELLTQAPGIQCR